jgi:hypothetical protein
MQEMRPSLSDWNYEEDEVSVTCIAQQRGLRIFNCQTDTAHGNPDGSGQDNHHFIWVLSLLTRKKRRMPFRHPVSSADLSRSFAVVPDSSN